MTLLPDYTLFIQIINFLILLIILNVFLYKPIRGILAKRRKEEISLKNSIDDFQSRSDKNKEGVEQGKIKALKEGAAEKESFKQLGQKAEQGILLDASSEAEKKIRNAREEIQSKVMDVRKSLEDQVALFSNDLVEKILGRSIQ